MGTIAFEGKPPFELGLQREPTTRSEGDTVVVTLPVFVPEASANTVDIRVTLSIQHAEYLYAQLDPALRLARAARANPGRSP